jgi:hypothetical protein
MTPELDQALDECDELTHEIAFAFYRTLIKDGIPNASASKLTLLRFFNRCPNAV